MAKQLPLFDGLKIVTGLILLVAAQALKTNAAYLPELGPGELRFQKTQKVIASYRLPPLDMGLSIPSASPAKQATTNEVAQVAPAPPVRNESPTALNNPTNTVVLEAKSGSSDAETFSPDPPLPQSPATQNDVLVNPQIVVPLLQPMHGNGPGRGPAGNPAVIVPAFLPPPPPTPTRSSTATYTVE
jgi:hypothetical protein